MPESSWRVVSTWGPYARFRRSLGVGRLPLVLVAAAELPRLSLADALEVLVLMADRDRNRYPRAAVRRLGRLALERPALDLAELRLAVCALDALPARAEVLPALRALARSENR